MPDRRPPISSSDDPREYTVEMLVAEVGDDNLAGHEKNAIYRVQYDGSINDHHGFCVIGGTVENLQTYLESNYREGMPLGDAFQLGRQTLERAENGGSSLRAEPTAHPPAGARVG